MAAGQPLPLEPCWQRNTPDFNYLYLLMFHASTVHREVHTFVMCIEQLGNFDFYISWHPTLTNWHYVHGASLNTDKDTILNRIFNPSCSVNLFLKDIITEQLGWEGNMIINDNLIQLNDFLKQGELSRCSLL